MHNKQIIIGAIVIMCLLLAASPVFDGKTGIDLVRALISKNSSDTQNTFLDNKDTIANIIHFFEQNSETIIDIDGEVFVINYNNLKRSEEFNIKDIEIVVVSQGLFGLRIAFSCTGYSECVIRKDQNNEASFANVPSAIININVTTDQDRLDALGMSIKRWAQSAGTDIILNMKRKY